jgi:hypothetical protein
MANFCDGMTLFGTAPLQPWRLFRHFVTSSLRHFVTEPGGAE